MNFMNSDTYGDTEIETVVRLLTAHVALIRQTSETLISGLFEDLDRLQAEIEPAVQVPEQQQAIKSLIKDLSVHLQLEDILRQQTFVLEAGLRKLSETRLPSTTTPDGWVEAALDEVKTQYVMRTQHDLHADVLGHEKDEPPDSMSTVFF